jgi:2-polyprenyl-6-hydroxyphenyl methylase/3-demethylubiquinone-9 3-methyltransferase
MPKERLRYGEGHWLRSQDHEGALAACQEQQNKAYSRVKARQLRELMGDIGGARCLDYGCGAGFFTVLCAKANAARVVGVDAEARALSTARYFAAKEGVEERCLFLCAGKFPEFAPGACFDVILLKDVIEHVEDDLTLLHSAGAALAPGGRIVLSTQNMMSLNYLLEGAYHRILRSDKNWCGWDPTHLRFYTPRSLEKGLKKAGLRCVEWRSAYILPYKLPRLPFSRGRFFRIDALSLVDDILGRRLPFNRFGWNITVKAVKAGP